MLAQNYTSFFKPLLLALLSLLLFACNSADNAGDKEGSLTISLTDARGDFTQYTVDVVSISLYKAGGAVVETLPNTTTLDFSEYVEVTEFLSSASVPAGYYTRAEITLDYSNAQILVEDENGASIAAQAVDDDGNPLGQITLETIINAHRGFQIKPGQAAALTLDFDLEASNEVEITDSGATVTVNPVLIANTIIEDDKSRRLRGLLAGVNLEKETFGVKIRPFRIRHRDFGRLTAHTDDDTQFEIDGIAYNQLDGLRVLAAQTGFTPLVALGKINFGDRRFLAEEVFAGSSVPWSDKDGLKGSVIARSGNTLSVIGATIEFDDGRFGFNDQIRVLIDDNTRVSKQGDPGNHHVIADISVGQKVMVLGQMSDDGMTMNATGDGIVRMRYSHVAGLVNSVSPLEVDLQYINRRVAGRYNFAGTGSNNANDADPDHYQIDSGALSLNSLVMADPLRVRGFPTPFMSAPLDFEARTIIDLSEVSTRMVMSYGAAGSPTAIVSLDDSGMLLDLVSASGRHYLNQAGIITDIASLASVPYIEPAGDSGLYAISQGRRVDVYISWREYQQALNRQLIEGHQVIYVLAKGKYDSTALSLGSRHLITRITR